MVDYIFKEHFTSFKIACLLQLSIDFNGEPRQKDQDKEAFNTAIFSLFLLTAC